MKCLYCNTEPNNKTTKDNLYVCSCYKLHADYSFGVKYEQHINAPFYKLKLGDKVKCFGYMKKTGANYIATDYDDSGRLVNVDLAYRNWEDKINDKNRIEDYDDQNRYELIKKEFEGIYVGTTTVNLNLTCEYFNDSYTEGWKTETNTPFKCARIYYADNKSRLVPFDMIDWGF